MSDQLPYDLTLPSPDEPVGDSEPTIEIPPFIGVYEIRGLIGFGGMGRVFLAIDPSLNREVAVKTLAEGLIHLPLPRQRFLREARTAASVNHENVVTVHAVSEEGGRPYLVMEFVRGESLQERLDRDGPLPLRDVIRIGAEIAAGLAAAHQQGVIHRDIKPANVLIEKDSGRTKLSDFGLARAADDIGVSVSGTIIGTPSYMAPEQARGEPVDVRADLFSLGCTLFAMITGKPPFEATSPLLIIRRICEDKTPALGQIRKDVPDWLGVIAERLLAKHPNERYQTAREVADLLHQIHQHLDPNLNAPLPFIPSRKPRHSRTTTIILGALIAVMLGGWLFFALFNGVGQLPNPNAIPEVSSDSTIRKLLGPPTLPKPEGVATIDGDVYVLSVRPKQDIILWESKTPDLKPGKWTFRVDVQSDDAKTGALVIDLTDSELGGPHAIGNWNVHPFTPNWKSVTLSIFPSRHHLTAARLRLRCHSEGVVKFRNVEVQYTPVDMSHQSVELAGHAPFTIEPRGVMLDHMNVVSLAGFLPDNRHMFTSAADGQLLLWREQSDGKWATHQRLREDEIHDLASSPDRSTFAMVGLGRSVFLWHWRDGVAELKKVMPTPTQFITGVGFSADGKTLIASGLRDISQWQIQSQVEAWDLPQAKSREGIPSVHTKGIGQLRLFPDGRHFLTAGADDRIVVWDAIKLQPIFEYPNSGAAITDLAIHPDGRALATARQFSGEILLWKFDGTDLSPVRPPLKLPPGVSGFSVAWGMNGEVLAVGCSDGTVRLFERGSWKLLATLNGHHDIVRRVRFSPDGMTLASCGYDWSVRMWKLIPKNAK